MSTSSMDSIFALGTTQIIVPPGATQAVLLTGIAAQNSMLLKYGSGGTLYILGVSEGVTLTAAELVTNASSHYLVGASETLSIDGPARFYLLSLSATTTVYSIRGKTQGT